MFLYMKQHILLFKMVKLSSHRFILLLFYITHLFMCSWSQFGLDEVEVIEDEGKEVREDDRKELMEDEGKEVASSMFHWW